jgi:hypothetical protein
MHHTLFFKIKDSAIPHKHKILELFFKSWVDGVCNNEVKYTLEEVLEAPLGSTSWEETYRAEFDRIEDAVALKLQGIPDEFKDYIEIII